MASLKVDALAEKRMYRQEDLSGEALERQVRATSHLVQIAREALINHRIDRDPDLPEPEKRWDAFFKVPDQEAVIEITSVGRPDGDTHNGLFVYVHKQVSENGRINTRQAVGLQTAKDPQVVNREDAVWLSRLDPDQLDGLAEMISDSSPLDKDAFASFMHPRIDLSNIEF